MADIPLSIQIGFTPDVLTAVDRLAAALERLVPFLPSLAASAGIGQSTPSPATVATPVQPEAPGGSAPVLDVSSLSSAEGPSRAAGGTDAGRPTPPGIPFKGWMTLDRQACLKRLWPTGASVAEIRLALEALPGPPLKPNREIATRANWLGVKRPAAMGENSPLRWLTADRAKLLRTLWPSRQLIGQIRLALENLPGDPVGTNRDIASAAAKLKIFRPPDMQHRRVPAGPSIEQPLPVSEPSPDTFPLQPSAQPIAPPVALEPQPSTPRPLVPPSRLDIMRRVGQSLAEKPRISIASADPIVAGQEAIRNWAATRGVRLDDGFDLAAVNAKARAIGHPGFILKTRHAQQAERAAE